MPVKRLEVVERSSIYTLHLLLLSPESWMFVKENPNRKKKKKASVDIIIWFTVLLLGVTIIQTRKIPQKRLVIFVHHLLKVFVGPGWVKIKRQDLPANYDSIRVCHVHFEDQFQRDIQVCGFFYQSIKFCLRLFHSIVLIIVDYVLMYGKKW